ncbi:uncharacterized protein LOC101846087 [Aplysia californica]|uniref:Uncharacterized protein LOC101846087 n=1 Tax=Aplysia californica TaxID=6500 RepID=A0ABM1A8A4_APLCA|nr:uncharacterized protein LOC101846087 [Aplysia californica]
MDDFRGSCGKGDYPLLHAINDVLGDEPVSKSAAGRPANMQWRPASKDNGIDRDDEEENDDEGEEEEDEDEETTSPRVHAPRFSGELKEGAKRALRMRFKKLKRRQRWQQKRARAQRRRFRKKEEDEEDEEEEEEEEDSSDEMSSTEVTTPVTTTSDENVLKVRWWPRRRVTKGKKWLPRRRTTTGMTRFSSTHRPRKIWRKRTESSRPRMAQEFGADEEEEHEVTSWQTTPWWQSGNHNLRAAAHPDSAFNARATGKPGLGLQRETTTEYSAPEVEHHDSATQASAAASAVNCRSLGAGTFADPHDCHRFVICLRGDWLDYPPHVMTCPTGTKFDPNLGLCNHADEVEC